MKTYKALIGACVAGVIIAFAAFAQNTNNGPAQPGTTTSNNAAATAANVVPQEQRHILNTYLDNGGNWNGVFPNEGNSNLNISGLVRVTNGIAIPQSNYFSTANSSNALAGRTLLTNGACFVPQITVNNTNDVILVGISANGLATDPGGCMVTNLSLYGTNGAGVGFFIVCSNRTAANSNWADWVIIHAK